MIVLVLGFRVRVRLSRSWSLVLGFMVIIRVVVRA